jgi:hypothetical protein
LGARGLNCHRSLSPGKIDRDRHCAAAASLRARAPLAISDICKDLDKAFSAAADRRRFMW